jgi:hypothetical protein
MPPPLFYRISLLPTGLNSWHNTYCNSKRPISKTLLFQHEKSTCNTNIKTQYTIKKRKILAFFQEKVQTLNGFIDQYFVYFRKRKIWYMLWNSLALSSTKARPQIHKYDLNNITPHNINNYSRDESGNYFFFNMRALRGFTIKLMKLMKLENWLDLVNCLASSQ